MIEFGTAYWFIFILAALLSAIGVTYLFYFKNKQNSELTTLQVRALMVLRFLSFFLISFMLLSPLIKSLKKITQDPIIVAAWDNSGSLIALEDSSQFANKIEELKEILSSEIENDYRLINYSFGENTESNEPLDFTDKKSDYSEMLNTISNNHFNENVGALIIAGDGIYNQGRNPLNLTDNINFPIYTIGFGDTTEITDARIQNVDVNRTAFSGNKFPVKIDLQFSKLFQQSLKLAVLQEGSEIAQTVITPPNNDYFTSQQFILDTGDPGLKHYTISLQNAENERNTQNNSSEFVINVLENKQKILILSEGPHPDVGAIKNTLESQQTYEVSVFTEEPYPSNITDFNLLILNQLPSAGKSMAGLIEKAKNNRIPVLYILGKNTFIPQFNAVSTGAEIQPLAGSMEEAQATFNPTYGTFELSEDFIEMLPKYPPLLVHFADYSTEPDFSTLFYQKIKNVETNRPLLVTGNLNGRKNGYIFGEGIWRWRLFNYLSNQTHDEFNEFVSQLIQYLALRENEDNFIVEYQPVYDEIENVLLHAEVYNDAFERINSEEVTVTISNEDGNEFDFTFDILDDNYRLNAGNLPVGDYSFTANVTIGNETFTEVGNFTVLQVDLENIETSANHRMLYQLARNSGGEFYQPGSISDLFNDIKNSDKLKPSTYFQESVNEFLNLKWLFFVLLLFLSVEWFLRKFWGIY